jgi:YaiO family outer membrane protein
MSGALSYGFKQQIDAEIGVRYFRFEPKSDIYIITFALEKYIKQYALAYKVLKIASSAGNGYTHSFRARRYTYDDKKYISVELSLSNTRENIQQTHFLGALNNLSSQAQVTWSNNWNMRWKTLVSSGAEFVKQRNDNYTINYGLTAMACYNF